MNPNKSVQEIMTTNLVTVSKKESVEEIRAYFSNNNFHHIPVVEEGSKLIGIISKQDFLCAAQVVESIQKQYSTDPQITAEDMMTQNPLSLDPDDTVGLAADIFLSNKLHALPIVEDDQLVGMITTHDLLKYSFNMPVNEKDTDHLSIQ